jgi:hypothetical protein
MNGEETGSFTADFSKKSAGNWFYLRQISRGRF